MKLTCLGWNTHFERSFEPFRAHGFEPARVVREERLQYVVVGERDDLPAEVTGKFRHEARSRIDYPAVGDWVAIQPVPTEGKAMIHAILPRASKFSRKMTGSKTEEQIIAANIDTVFLVCGLDGNFNLRRIERYLAPAWDSGATPVVVLNKSDVCENPDALVAEVRAIARGVPVHVISALEERGLHALKPYLKRGRTIALLGSSGVGKSTLINALLGEERQLTTEVREKDSHGRHTTTYRELILLSSGAMLVDNPGMREMQLWTEEEALDTSFKDIEALGAGCRFRDCRHLNEPDCAVRAALAVGTLLPRRYESYRKLKQELLQLSTHQDERVRQARRLSESKSRNRHARKENRK